MGNSHYRSNIIAKDGTQKIVGFNIASVNSMEATNLILNTLASAPKVHGTTQVIAGSYIRIGTSKYLFSTTSAAASTVSRQVYDTVGTPYKGSLSFGVDGVWLHKNNFPNSSATAVKLGTV